MNRTSRAHRSYSLYYHMTWSVDKGLPLLNEQIEEHVKNFIKEKAKELEVRIIEIEGGAEIVYIITRESAENLGLAKGKDVYAIIKASNVMVGVD